MLLELQERDEIGWGKGEGQGEGRGSRTRRGRVKEGKNRR